MSNTEKWVVIVAALGGAALTVGGWHPLALSDHGVAMLIGWAELGWSPDRYAEDLNEAIRLTLGTGFGFGFIAAALVLWRRSGRE